MKHLKFTLAIIMLFASFQKATAQKASTHDVFNPELFGKEHSIIGQDISDQYVSVTLPEGTKDFQSGNLVRVFYQPYGQPLGLNMVMFVCNTSLTNLTLRSVNETSTTVPFNRSDVLKSVALMKHNVGSDQKQKLHKSCQ